MTDFLTPATRPGPPGTVRTQGTGSVCSSSQCWGPSHYECAVGQIDLDEALLRQAIYERDGK